MNAVEVALEKSKELKKLEKLQIEQRKRQKECLKQEKIKLENLVKDTLNEFSKVPGVKVEDNRINVKGTTLVLSVEYRWGSYTCSEETMDREYEYYRIYWNEVNANQAQKRGGCDENTFDKEFGEAIGRLL